MWVSGGKRRRAAEAPKPKRQPASRFVGVSWNKGQRKWQASFWHEGKQHHLGTFTEV